MRKEILNRAYFEILEEIDLVTVSALTNRCTNPTKYPDTYTTDFNGNFAQMKTDSSNSHCRHNLLFISASCAFYSLKL